MFFVFFEDYCVIWVKKSIPKTGSKKGVPRISNNPLLTCPEAPRARTSRAHFSNKKQLFEQLLKHCSKISLEKWAECEFLAMVRTTIEALFENLAGKVRWIHNSCKSKTAKTAQAAFQIIFSNHAGDLTRSGQGPANLHSNLQKSIKSGVIRSCPTLGSNV